MGAPGFQSSPLPQGPAELIREAPGSFPDSVLIPYSLCQHLLIVLTTLAMVVTSMTVILLFLLQPFDRHNTSEVLVSI